MQTKPSGFGDPDRLAALDSQYEAELASVEAKLKILDNELHEYFILRARALDLRVQHAVVALCELTGRSIVMAAAMSPDPEHNLKGYRDFLEEVIGASSRAMNASALGQLITQIFGGKSKCSSDSSSAEASASFSSTPSESPSSSSGESDNA